MSRALKRAQIPLWYTEGFNPHPYMSFSLPLSLGVESLCESVDLRIIGDITNDEIKYRLNNVLPQDIKNRAHKDSVFTKIYNLYQIRFFCF